MGVSVIKLVDTLPNKKILRPLSSTSVNWLRSCDLLQYLELLDMAKNEIGLSYGPGVFSAEEFEKAAQEVVNPDLSDYEFFVESHGTKIYRHYREVRGKGSCWNGIGLGRCIFCKFSM